MSRRYLISRPRKVVLLVASDVPGQKHAYGRMGVSPEFSRAEAVAQWRTLYGPSIEDVNVHDNVPCPVFPWADSRGGWKPNWMGWFLAGTTKPSKHWAIWPPAGGELSVLGLTTTLGPVPAPPALHTIPVTGPGQDVCCDCDASLVDAPVVFGAGMGAGTGANGFFRCESCHYAAQSAR